MEKNAKFVQAPGGLIALLALPPLQTIKKRVLRQMWLIALALLWALAIFIEG